MSQTATLYRIGKNEFPGFVADPAYANLKAINKWNASFQQTHEGFRFILSKGRDAATVELVDQIFYPVERIGEDDAPIHYSNPTTVAAIAALLATINADSITALYDANELNENGIYPEVWNTKPFEQHGFNPGLLIHELAMLKDIYAQAAAEGDYVLSFVG